jgi:hypothetical protein
VIIAGMFSNWNLLVTGREKASNEGVFATTE